MTVSTIDSAAEFVTNGVTTNYPFYFKFLANEDLVVTYVSPAGVSSVLTLGTQYTVNGAGNDQGGSVVTTTALAGPGQLVVSREMDAYQQTSLRNQGKFLAETHEDVFDRLTMLIQQGLEISRRALTRPFGRDYFFAENRRITSVKDPVDAQDAANKRWSMTYIDSLLSSMTGPINNALNIFYLQGLTGAISRSVQSALRDAVVSDQDFASVQDAITGIGQQQRPLSLGGRSVTLGSIPVNTYGVPIRGGKLIGPSTIAGQVTQINTYADDVSGLMIGRENLMAFWRNCSGGSLHNVYLYGDSTVEQNPVFYPKLSHVMVQEALYAMGVNGVKVFNRGVSGTSWSDLSPTAGDISAGTHLIIIKYGINDAGKIGDPRAIIAQDARAKLAYIRGLANGNLENLSILLMGPNTTYRPSTGQDYRFYEDLRPLYIQLCKEFDCAYFDTYAYMQSSRKAPGWWLDSIPPYSEGIHPDPLAVDALWREVFTTHVFGQGQWNYLKSNNFHNINNYTRAAMANMLPGAYWFGKTIETAFKVNGWPYDGTVETTRNADGTTTQVNKSVDAVPRTASRTGLTAAWTQWTGVPIPITAFSGTWVNGGGGYASAGYQLGDDGFIELYGIIKNGTSGTAAFVLPAGARPAFAQMDASGRFYYDPATFAVIPTVASTALVGLAGIRFRMLET
ncbi:hypothetical protein BFW86_24325 [Pseudomonas fluorescens]|nr:hypothetical protein BFW86_24325 [Pseudomonas fluorescens]